MWVSRPESLALKVKERMEEKMKKRKSLIVRINCKRQEEENRETKGGNNGLNDDEQFT